VAKLNEISDPNDRASKLNYVKELWGFWREVRAQALTRITNYLFILNTGALLGSLTYVASKQPNSSIQCAIWLFAAGTLCSLVHATLDYYSTESYFSSYRKEVGQFYENKIDWAALVEKNEKRPRFDWVLHVVGWAGGMFFIFGMLIGVPQIR
jgi:hypothetical protein